MTELETRTRKLSLVKLEAGGHAVRDEAGNQLGVIDHKALMDHIKSYQEGLEKMSEVVVKEASGAGVDEEVKRATVRMMEQTGLSFGKAMSRALSLNPSLKQRYDRQHKASFSAQENKQCL